MGRESGLWTAHPEGAYDDPRTLAAAAVLEAGGVPAYVAPIVAAAALHRLECWAIRNGDAGLVGHLAADRFASVCWPEHVRGPRPLGRGARVGELLRRALATRPEDGSDAYLEPSCGGTCEGNGSGTGTASDAQTCQHLTIKSWATRLPKIVADRIAKRGRSGRNSAQGNVDPHVSGPEPVVEAPGGIRTTVARPATEGRPLPNPTQEGGSSAGIGDARATPVARPASGRAAEVVAALLGQPTRTSPAAAAGSAAASRRPGVGAGETGGDRRGIAARALLGAEPNVRPQVTNGRDVTLQEAGYYLFRAGRVAPERREGWERDLGTAPTPGRLLAAADPARFDLLVSVLAQKWPQIRNPDAYVRSTLATAWRDYLEQLEGVAERRLHAEALDATRARAAGG